MQATGSASANHCPQEQLTAGCTNHQTLMERKADDSSQITELPWHDNHGIHSTEAGATTVTVQPKQ
jgi:hypothetical protein